MKAKNKKWDKEEKEFRTRLNQIKIEDARKFIEKIDNDPDKDERLSLQICKVCYYTKRISLQAFTNTSCGCCNVDMIFPNSDIDSLCERCARINNACKHCGGEMD